MKLSSLFKSAFFDPKIKAKNRISSPTKSVLLSHLLRDIFFAKVFMFNAEEVKRTHKFRCSRKSINNQPSQCLKTCVKAKINVMNDSFRFSYLFENDDHNMRSLQKDRSQTSRWDIKQLRIFSGCDNVFHE